MDRDDLDEAAEPFLWQEGEREALQADIAERARRIRSAENLAWCEARNAERAEAEVETQQPAQERTMQQPAALTDDWVRYIKSQLDKRTATMSGAFGEVLGRVEKRHKDALDDLRTELMVVKNELTKLRAEASVRGSLDEVQTRLDKIEEQRTPLRAIGKALSA